MSQRIHSTDTLEHIGKEVHVSGWIHRIRDHGQLMFIDLRDKKGIVQIVIDSEHEAFTALSKELGNEYVIAVSGIVLERSKERINPNIPTGKVEIEAKKVEILSTSKPLPFSIDTDGHEIDEQVRLKYRYLDLRRERMQDMLKFRSEFIFFVRNWYQKHGFIEVETPLLTVTSPEGARDFIVPSRTHKGQCYVLPQAPQQFKQLLMVGGIEKYFQIAPCFRDEDPRADRHAGAFYQIDTEMAFVTQEDFFTTMEPLFIEMVETLTDKKIQEKPFPRIPYRTAMDEYGSDKPDLRFGLKLQNFNFLKTMTGFSVFQKAEMIRGIVVPDVPDMSRKTIDDLGVVALNAGAKGLAWVRRKADGSFDGSIAKFMTDEVLQILMKECDMRAGSLLLLVADEPSLVYKALNLVRLKLGDLLGMRDPKTIAFAWIVDFPMYEWDADNQKYDFMHNPFSMPQGGLDTLEKASPLDIVAYQYDIVANNLELASGAIRNHEPETMIKAFEIAGYTREEVKDKFGHMLGAFEYGAPPHGGFAPGVDRVMMLLRDEASIREIYAFPLSSDGKDLMMGAPSAVSEKQLKDLGLEYDIRTKAMLEKKAKAG